MYFSFYPYHLDHDEILLAEYTGSFFYPSDAPAPFGSRKSTVRIVLTSKAVIVEGQYKKWFQKPQMLAGSFDLDQIKMEDDQPAVHVKMNRVLIQCLDETVELMFSSQTAAQEFSRMVWDRLTGTSEMQRQIAATARSAVSAFIGLGRAVRQGIEDAVAGNQKSRREK